MKFVNTVKLKNLNRIGLHGDHNFQSIF